MTSCCVDSITTMTVTQNTARNDDDVDNDDDGDITLPIGKSENTNAFICCISVSV